MSEDLYIATVALPADAVQDAIKGVNRRVDAIAMQAATQGAHIAGVQFAIERLEQTSGASDETVHLVYTQVNKTLASVGMMRAELAGIEVRLADRHDDLKADLDMLSRRVKLALIGVFLLTLIVWLK